MLLHGVRLSLAAELCAESKCVSAMVAEPVKYWGWQMVW